MRTNNKQFIKASLELWFYCLVIICSFSCRQSAISVPEPNQHPNSLKSGKFIAPSGKVVNTSPLADLPYISVNFQAVPSTVLTTIPEQKNYQIANKPKFISTQPKAVDRSKMLPLRPKTIHGKKKMAPWPKWTPAKFAYQATAPFAFRYLDMKQGLNDNWCQRMMEDSKGRIWTGSWSGGLSVWDGVGLFHFTTENGLSTNNVGAILEDKNGNFWIGTSGGLDVWDGKVLTSYAIGDSKSNLVGKILEDSQGNIWISTWKSGLTKWDGHQFTNLTTKEGLSSNQVISLEEDNNGHIWIATVNGVNIWDGKRFQYLGVEEGLPNRDVTSILNHSSGTIWIGTANGLAVWDGKGLQVYTHKDGLSNSYIWNLTEDNNNRIWITTQHGLNYWDGKGFKHYTEMDGLSNNIVLRSLLDKNGKIWLGTQGGGINVWDKEYLSHFSETNGLWDDDLYCLLESRDGNVWIGTQGGVLIRYNGKDFTHFQTPNNLNFNLIRCLLEDRDGNIWIGAMSSGLSKWDGQQIQNWKFTQNLNYDVVLSLLEDQNGRIWVGTESGLKVWDGNGFKEYATKNGLTNNTISALLEDKNGKIWVGTKNGLSILDDNKITNYFETDSLTNGLVINSLLQDRDEKIWIGTETGLVTWEDHRFTFYTTKEGLSHNFILSLFQDATGNIWVGTKNGLNRLYKNKEQKKWKLEVFQQEDGLRGQMIRQLLVDQKNQLWLAGNKGLDRMDLTIYESDTSKPTLFLREMNPFFDKVDWRQTQIATEKGEKPTSGEQAIALSDIAYDSVIAFTNLPHHPIFPYNINHLNFHWSATHTNPHKVQYSYILEGNNQNWSPLIKTNETSFQNLSHGNYTFKIRAVSGNGQWSDTQTYAFTILPPWWQTSWAKILYALSILLGLFGIYSYQRRRWQLQTQLEVEQEKAQRLEELDTFRSRFYTNITHEFRTPLTVIKGMSEQISNENIKNLIQRNSNRLLNMVNQLLDLSKIESNSLQVDWIQGDIIMYLKYLTESYHSYTAGQNLNLAFFSKETSLEMDYDPEKLQQILINLLSNAIKFTPEYGSVKVLVARISKGEKATLQIEVKDTGNGISKENLPHIFDRFYQIDDSTTRKGEGSGIGLALVKELVQLMEGSIEVESEEGKGAVFRVNLPIHHNAIKQRNPSSSNISSIVEKSTGLLPSELYPTNANGEKPLVLVIEDNADVVEYIFSCLKTNYELHTARNGNIGVEKAIEIIPDLIICDVMMPEMDGFEVCQYLKSAKATSHIPIIILTAKATQEDKIIGLTYGANAYLTKPFDKAELLIRIKNLVALSQRFREQLQNPNNPTNEKTPQAIKEAAFLEELNNLIRDNLENDLFNTQYLCKEIAMSRTQLHRKLKALTGESTANYIRTFRLQKAKTLLETTDLPVGEIAHSVGFKDFSHFSRSYIKAFGIKPSETRK